MWIYEQSTGRLRHDGQHVATGYSGSGGQSAAGPVPRGEWRFGALHDSFDGGPKVLPLFACGPGGHGRFLIVQGTPAGAAMGAVDGFIALPLEARVEMSESNDRILQVSA